MPFAIYTLLKRCLDWHRNGNARQCSASHLQDALCDGGQVDGEQRVVVLGQEVLLEGGPVQRGQGRHQAGHLAQQVVRIGDGATGRLQGQRQEGAA